MRTILLLAVLTACVGGHDQMLPGTSPWNDPPPRAAVMEHSILGLTFEIRLDTVPGWKLRPLTGFTVDTMRYGSQPCDTTYAQWWLYVTQTTPDTVRWFRVCRLEVVK